MKTLLQLKSKGCKTTAPTLLQAKISQPTLENTLQYLLIRAHLLTAKPLLILITT